MKAGTNLALLFALALCAAGAILKVQHHGAAAAIVIAGLFVGTLAVAFRLLGSATGEHERREA